MAKDPYQTAVANWSKRATIFRAKGYKDSQWQTLAQHDIQGVLQGHSPMSDQEATDAFLAAVQGPPIHDPQPGSSWTDVIGNVAGDVQGLVTGFVPGVANYIATLPEQASDFVKLAQQDPATQKKYGMETSGGLGAFVRDMARTPVFGPLIPGLRTASAATTEEGRTALAQHPVSTLVDVLPVAKEAGLSLAGAEAADVGTAREAFQAGKPLRGAVRSTADLLSNVPKVGRFFSRVEFNKTLFDMGLHPDIIEGLARPLQEIKGAAEREMQTFIKGDLFQSMKDFTDEQRRTMAEAANNPGVNDENIVALPPEQQAVLQNIRYFNEAMFKAKEGEGLFKVPGPDGKLHVYSETEPVVKTFKKASRAQELAQKASDKLAELWQKRQDREANLQSRYGKVKKYMESETDFANRDAHPITPEAIREASAPLVEAFRLNDPLAVYRGIFGSQSQQALTAVLRDVKALSGEEGLLAKWDDAMKSHDIPTARKTLTQIKQKFAHKSWDQTPYANNFRSHILDLQKEMVGIQRRMRAQGFGMKTLATAIRNEKQALSRAQTTAAIADSTMAKHLELLHDSPPAAYHPILGEILKTSASRVAEVKYAGNVMELDAALKGIQQSSTFEELRGYIGDEEASTLLKEVKGQWQTIAQHGIDPIFLHNVTAAQLDFIQRPSVLPNRFYTPGIIKKRIFNIGTSVHDVLASVTDHTRQMISEAATEKFINEHVKGFVEEEPAVRAALHKATADVPIRGFMDRSAVVDAEISKHYVPFDPERSGFGKYFAGAEGKQLLIPKGIDRALGQLMKDDQIPLEGAYDGTIKLWKMSVLTTPRHLSHIALGGTMMLAAREPGALLQLRRAWNLTKTDSEEYASIINQHPNDLTTDQLFNFTAGKSIGRLMAEKLGTPARALSRFEEHIANTEKVAAALSAEARGLSRDAAIRTANKVIVDMNAMSPFERVVLRKVFPFYGFTRHLFRYLFTYPVDHPLRASILTNLANQHREDWKSGLPQSFSWLFFLGGTDENGNATGYDYRSIDPFRSFFNDFTVAGITSQLNPVGQVGLHALGVDVLSAAPELYPQSHYDPATGTIVAERPQTGLAQIVEAIIPETQAVDAILSVTDKYRTLAQSNPRAYRQAIFQSLGIPFAPIPVNLPYEKSKAETKRFTDAQKAIASALTTGNFDDVKRYNQVPVPSNMKRFLGGASYASPASIEAVYKALVARLAAAGIQGAAPKAYLPPAPRTPTSH